MFSISLFGKPKISGDWLVIPSIEFLDTVAQVPSVLVYKRNLNGKFEYTQSLSYGIQHKLSSLTSNVVHSVSIAEITL